MTKKILILLTVLSLMSCSSASAENLMTRACTDTANQYPYSRDRLLYEEYAELFTQDASFQIEGNPKVQGREAIVNALKSRGPNKVTRHINNVVDMRVTGPQSLEGVSYVQVWSVDRDAYDEGKNTVSSPWIIGEYHDKFEMDEGRCLIKERFVKIIYQGS